MDEVTIYPQNMYHIFTLLIMNARSRGMHDPGSYWPAEIQNAVYQSIVSYNPSKNIYFPVTLYAMVCTK